jgi:hypothetical protein
MVKKINIILGALVFCFCLGLGHLPVLAYDQEFVLRSEPILSSGANRLDLHFNISHAKVTFKLTEDPSFIIKVLVKYDGGAPAPLSYENLSEGTFSIDFSSGDPAEQNMANPLHDWEVQIGRYDLETRLTFDFVGVQANLDLGGMPLDALFLNLKGTQATLDFSESALLSVRKFGIACEGTFLALSNIGNTGFEAFQLKGSGSSFKLDFKGIYAAGDYNADFNLNGSSARIILPATAAASVVHRPSNRPVELTGSGWSKERGSLPDGYTTDDYEDQESRLNLVISSTAASVSIKREGTNLQYQLSY